MKVFTSIWTFLSWLIIDSHPRRVLVWGCKVVCEEQHRSVEVTAEVGSPLWEKKKKLEPQSEEDKGRGAQKMR